MRNLLALKILLLSLPAFAQPEWINKFTPGETLESIISIDDSTKTAEDIYNAALIALPKVQSDKILDKKKLIAGTMGKTTGGEFAGLQQKSEESRIIIFNVQEPLKANRLYYEVKVQTKDGRYKITIDPSGTSGIGLYNPVVPWDQAYKNNGNLKGIYKKYYERYYERMELFLSDLEKAINENLNQDDNW